MGLQNIADRLEIVLRADRTHNAALCERNDDIAVFPAEGDAALAEGAFPEGLVEVPDDEPHRLRRKLTHVLSSAALGTGAICYLIERLSAGCARQRGACIMTFHGMHSTVGSAFSALNSNMIHGQCACQVLILHR